MPKVNHQILSWARDQAGLSIQEAAEKLKIKDGKKSTAVEKLLAYEQGAEPSRAKLKEMAKLYRRPLLTFYLSDRPRLTKRGEDFRSLPDNLDPQQNFYVDVLIQDVTARQGVIRETLEDEDEATPLTFVGQQGMEDGVPAVVQALRELLGMDIEEFRVQKSYPEAFKFLRRKVEDQGVFVLLKGNLGSWHSDIELKVFRGFVLSDNVAPLIVINPQESRSARAFTLLHEMTHLLLGQTGISGSFVEREVEKFCDAVASEFLLPEKELASFAPDSLELEDIRETIAFYAQDKRISKTMVAYRLLQRGTIDGELFQALRDHYYGLWQKEKSKNRKKEGGPNGLVVQRSYLGSALIDFAQRMNFSGALSTTKAGLVLGVKPLKVQNLFNNAAAR